MKRIILLTVLGVFAFGCARLSLQAPKDPIKLDVSMRLDVYQHVQNDIDSVENIVAGAKAPSPIQANPANKQSFLHCFVGVAYAEELDPQVEQAALSRKARREEVMSLLSLCAVGENKLGLLEIRGQAAAADINQLVSSENSDRMTIYRSLAVKNNTNVEDIQILYASRLQKDAPNGAPIEVFNGSAGNYQWQNK